MSNKSIETKPSVGTFFTTVTLGKVEDAETLRHVIERVDRSIFSRDVLMHLIHGKIELSSLVEKVDLYELKVSDLGFTEPPTDDAEVHARAFELGFRLCTVEAIVLSVLDYHDDKTRIAAMEYIYEDGARFVIGLDRKHMAHYLNYYVVYEGPIPLDVSYLYMWPHGK